MASLVIRGLDDKIKMRLRVRAAEKGHSMEQEAREILTAAVATETPEEEHWVDRIHRRFAAIAGVELPPIRRGPIRKPPDFSKW